jgi:hypothetical protein
MSTKDHHQRSIIDRLRAATKSHDEAIQNWAAIVGKTSIIGSPDADHDSCHSIFRMHPTCPDTSTTESRLVESLHEFYNACQKQLQNDAVPPIVLIGNVAGHKRRPRRCLPRRNGMTRVGAAVEPIAVNVKPHQQAMDCYGNAFLVQTMSIGHYDGDDDEDDDSTSSSSFVVLNRPKITLMAAIMFYNVGLFYHIRLLREEEEVQHRPRPTNIVVHQGGDSGWRTVRRYYDKANALLGRYMELTRGAPLWMTLQAALWHNLADSYRYRIGNDPVSWIYFTQLDSIKSWVEEDADRVFFDRAVAIARMQQDNCVSATAA